MSRTENTFCVPPDKPIFELLTMCFQKPGSIRLSGISQSTSMMEFEIAENPTGPLFSMGNNLGGDMKVRHSSESSFYFELDDDDDVASIQDNEIQSLGQIDEKLNNDFSTDDKVSDSLTSNNSIFAQSLPTNESPLNDEIDEKTDTPSYRMPEYQE